MAEVEVGPGLCIGFGGSNARVAECSDGDISHFRSTETPSDPQEFFSWMATGLLKAADAGREWLVAGFPGPVSADGTQVGPMANVSGMSTREYDLREQLMNADPAVERKLSAGFTVVAVNDGTLAAQAAARVIGDNRFSRTAALIVGTGIGTGLAVRDTQDLSVYRVDQDPLEIGHVLFGWQPSDTFEARYSGPGLTRTYGMSPEDIPADHRAWRVEGKVVGRLALMLGVLKGAELVVPTGGVGAGASGKLQPHVDQFLTDVLHNGNATQRALLPDVRYVPPEDHAAFEMFGAHGVMQDFLTR